MQLRNRVDSPEQSERNEIIFVSQGVGHKVIGFRGRRAVRRLEWNHQQACTHSAWLAKAVVRPPSLCYRQQRTMDFTVQVARAVDYMCLHEQVASDQLCAQKSVEYEEQLPLCRGASIEDHLYLTLSNQNPIYSPE